MPSAALGPQPVRSQHFREGGAFEEQAGYARAVRRGPIIAVSGTTCTHAVSDRNTGEQTVECLRRAIAAVEHLGGQRADIVRTRLYLGPGADWEAASTAHREVLGDVAPANTTLFVGGLIGDDLLVEVEVEAFVLAASQPEPESGPEPGPKSS
jgi:enamine deaminase RidA (YjgF/YER057c/UK114 family)